MKNSLVRPLTISLVHTLIFTLLVSQLAYAQTPVVSASELKQAITNASKVRQDNLDQIGKFFSSELGRKALSFSRVEPDRFNKVVSTLTSEEVAKLAAQTRQVQNDFAAGALTNQQITYILIALAAAVVVLVLK
jgi:hypothetical protein